MAEPCTYVPFAEYDWALITLFVGSRGRCHGVSLAWNWTVVCLLVAMHAVAIWVNLGLIVQTMMTFKTWKTWYFWSMMVTSCGIIIYVCVIDILWFTMFGNRKVLGAGFYYASLLFINIGSLLILWSRLHLIVNWPRVLKMLLAFILGILFPLYIVLAVGGSIKPGTREHYFGELFWHRAVWIDPMFPLLEIFLVCAYIALFVRFWFFGTGGLVDKHVKRALLVMVIAEAFAVACDATIIALWYAKIYLARTMISPLLFALKLKVEFLVLNRLTSMSKRRVELRHITVSNEEADASGPSYASERGHVAYAEVGMAGPMQNNSLERPQQRTPTPSKFEL